MTDVRWGSHTNDLGDWCPWSGRWADDGGADTCPARCEAAEPAEPDPHSHQCRDCRCEIDCADDPCLFDGYCEECG